MTISAFELYTVGIGPSSSHTIGPMRAAKLFCETLLQQKKLDVVKRIQITIYGSLAHTGEGHGTLSALVAGLTGEVPEKVEPTNMLQAYASLQTSKKITLLNTHLCCFDLKTDIILNKTELLSLGSNGMHFQAFDQNKQLCAEKTFFSIGGGFIIDAEQPEPEVNFAFPYPFNSAEALLSLCQQENCSIAELMRRNEYAFQSEDIVHQKLNEIIDVMFQSIARGREAEGILPGVLKVKRRAAQLRKKLLEKGKPASYELSDTMGWLNMYAIAVNEENAAGGRVVTAPTNGAAGIIPAVMKYYKEFYPDVTEDDLHNFLLTAAAIGALYKKGASISGAEVGCQGEVGVASSMAAAALTAVLGGSIAQVEQAAEIAMEHHLGMTCDPVAGLVQIPCIERNAMGAVKAVNASRLALLGDGDHYVSLDKVIKTMRETGADMNTIYKETSLGGLAVNVSEC